MDDVSTVLKLPEVAKTGFNLLLFVGHPQVTPSGEVTPSPVRGCWEDVFPLPAVGLQSPKLICSTW